MRKHYKYIVREYGNWTDEATIHATCAAEAAEIFVKYNEKLWPPAWPVNTEPVMRVRVDGNGFAVRLLEPELPKPGKPFKRTREGLIDIRVVATRED